METALGCASLALIAFVSFGVAAVTTVWTGLAVGAALVVLWMVVTGTLASKAAARHRAEREAVRAREVAQHQALMARREAEAAELRAQRYASLCARFGQRAADDILAGRYWQGATFDMVREALGEPVDVREKVFKTKTETTWLYNQLSAQRFGLKIHFENGEVVGWDN